eukprot:6085243-Pleurochrysis_carterae.AAC.1
MQYAMGNREMMDGHFQQQWATRPQEQLIPSAPLGAGSQLGASSHYATPAWHPGMRMGGAPAAGYGPPICCETSISTTASTTARAQAMPAFKQL